MVKKNTGKEYELLVQKIFKNIYHKFKEKVDIDHNVELDSPFGKRQFDVVIKVYLPHTEILTVVEARDYNSKIQIDKIDAFYGKMLDVNAAKGIMITKKGFGKGALLKAKGKNIDLYKITNFNDFTDFDIEVPILIQRFRPIEYDIKYVIKECDLIWGISAFNDNRAIINGSPINKILNSNWNNDNLEFKLKEGFQEVILKDFESPYKLRLYSDSSFKFPIEVPIFEVKCFIKLGFYHLLTDLRKIMVKDAIADADNKEIQFFVDSNSIEKFLFSDEEKNYITVDEHTNYKFQIDYRDKSDLA